MIEIKDISGKTRFSTPINKGAKGKFTLMKEDYIILPFSVPSPIPFKLGDYVDLSGVLDESLGGKLAKVYEITELQKPTYNTSTGGYDYELKMNAYYWKWKNKIFKYTPEQAGGEASWSLTAALDVQLGVFLRNLKALGYTYKGTDFTFSIDDTVENKAVAMTYDNINLLDALFSMAGEDKWNCDCWITDNVIHFGRNEFGDAVKIERGVEASDITRSESEGTYATRIYAFGSTKNIPTNYRPTDEQVVINGIVQKRLMLPADTPYIDAYEGMSQEEAIEDVVVFDDVYPRQVGTLSDVHTRTEKVESEDGTKETVTYYRYKDSGLTFKEEYIIEGQELQITFQSGKLNGMAFGVIFNPDPKDESRGEQLWEIVRNENYGRPLPDDMMYPANGDKYILSGFNIQLVSDQYIPEAEQELKDKAQKYAEKVKKDDGTYPVTLRSDWVHEDLISRTFEFGQRINLVDDTYFENGRISRVLGWEMSLDVPWDSPVYTIGESMPYSRIGEIEDKVDALTYKGQVYTGNGSGSVYVIKVNDSTPPSDSNVFSALRSLKMFLRKDQQDETNYLLSLLGGILVNKIAKFGNFITGVSGGMIDEAGNMEMESGYFRKRLFVPEIAYNRITYFKGRAVISPGGGCKVKSYIKNDDGSFTVIPDLTEADGLSQFVDDILSAFFTTKNEEGKLTGFAQMQFRVTEADYDAKTFKIVNRPGNNYEPGEEMILAQTGNFTDLDRQTYILFDTLNGNNCITFFDNANTWDPEPAQMKSWLGKKKGMKVQGFDCDNYSAVLQNILMTGLIFQVDEITGENVRVPIDMGEWDPDREGGYAYYMRVSYPGGLWLCVNPNGTTKEPGEGSVDWLLQVKDGTAGEPGLSIIGGGRWDATKTPYAANTMVSLYNCVFLSNVETSEPPIPIARFKDGSYRRLRDGGYILAGSSSNPELVVHPDWTMLLDGRNLEGTNITFLGSFAQHPNNPLEGQAYYNTTDRCSYLYSGGHWHLLVRDGKDGRDYEYIYTRTNIIDLAPDKPDSKQQDDYVPEGWTDDFLGVDEDHQVEWGCKRNKINGVWSEWSTPAVVHRWAKDGVSAVIADLDNEMVNCRLNTEGRSVEQQNWIVNVSMWYGTELQDLTALDFTAPEGFVVLTDKSKGLVSVTVDKDTALQATNNVILHLQATVRGQIVNRDLTFTVAGVRDGENGEDAVLYSLVPSETVIKRYENGAYNVSSVTCQRMKTVGHTTTATTEGVLKYSVDGGNEIEMQNNDEIRTEGISGSVRFAFYVDDKLVDVESVPVVADGQKGEDGSSITSEGHWDASRVPLKTGSIVDFAGSLFVALRETSEPPYPIARFKDGSYRRMRDGAYILAGSSANRQLSADWRLFLEGVEYNVSADLDNEMVNCRLDSDGKAVSGQSWFPQVTMWYGTSRMVLSEIYYNAPAGFTVSADTNTGIVAVSVAAGTSVAEMNEIKVIAIGTRSGKTYSRELTFTVAGVRDGAAAVFYSLLPSVSSIKKNKQGKYSVDTVSCKRQKTIGDVLSDTTEGELKYSIDNGGEVAVNDNEAISVNKITQKIQFVFYVNGRIVDRETIPMIADGLDGDHGQDGTSVVSIGHWDMSKVPVKANSLVNFAGGTYLALRDTSEPPYPLARFKDGSYRRLRNGGYILAGRSGDKQLSADWRVMMEAPEVSIVYTLVPAVNVISFTSNGSPSPSSVQVECKQTNGSSMSSCNSLYLVARKYNGSWLAHVGAVQAQSIGVPATAGYSQFAVRAYKTASAANSWNEDYVAQVTIGVATDGSTGDRGPAGAFPYDCGVYKSGTTYVWNESRRDKIIYAFSGIYYVYLVKNYGARVTAAPSNINGDSNWEMAQKFANIATDTLFADGANVAGFMFKNGVMRSQDETNGVANMILNGKTGYFHCVNAEITGKFIGNLTADSGTIGGFSIGSKSLSNLAADVALSIGNYNSSTTKLFSVNRGSGAMLQVRHDNGICISAETYGSTDSVAIKALCNASGYGQAIQAYGNVSLLARPIEKTRINGIVVNTRRITSSATINANDDFIILGNSGNITVTMPSTSASPAGKILYMKRVSGKGAITLSGSFRNPNNAGGASSLVVNDDVSRFFVRDDQGYWVQFTCG